MSKTSLSRSVETPPGPRAGNELPTVYLIDDDYRVLKALKQLLLSHGYWVKAYSSVRLFLAQHSLSTPGCILTDLVMPNSDGLDLQRALHARGAHQPVIFMSGKGTTPEAVDAMKGGALDYLCKPVQEETLIAALETAFVMDALHRDARRRLALLSPRENQVLRLLLTGRLNKQVAFECGITERTVKYHRTNLMAKLAVCSIAEVSQLVFRAGWDADTLPATDSAA